MNLFFNFVYFLLPLLVIPLMMCQQINEEDDSDEMSPGRFGRYIRYSKHRDQDSRGYHKDTKTKLVHETAKNDIDRCADSDDEDGPVMQHLNWFLHRENSDGLRKAKKAEDDDKVANVEEIAEPEDSEEDNSIDEESNFDGREDFESDENSKVARSVDESKFEPGTVCEGENCKNNNAQMDRSLGFMDSASGNSKKTTNIALKAAQEAQAAENAQEMAGKEASKQAKFQLAEKAIQAAKASQAALSAKHSIVEQLERELRESEVVVQDLSSSIQQSEANANAALRAAQQAASQLKMLTEAVQSSQGNLGNSEQAAQGAQQELSEKTQLLEAAKNRVEQLLREMKTARIDYANTKQAAFKAMSAAKQAKANASRVRRQGEISDEMMEKIVDYMKSRYQ